MQLLIEYLFVEILFKISKIGKNCECLRRKERFDEKLLV